MMPACPSSMHSRRRSGARAVLGLLIMLAVVLPHLTLLAAPALAGAPQPGPVEMAPPATASALPCHEDMPGTSHPVSAPGCCVIVCALLPAIEPQALPARRIGWSRWRRQAAALHLGISHAPAKPPPRPEQHAA